MATNASNPTPYCSPADALRAVDARLWGQLCGDANQQSTAAQLADLTTAAGQRMAFLLKAASGKVEMAALRGGKYSAADLAALQGNSQAVLAMLTARLAMYDAYRVRDPGRPIAEGEKQVNELLKAMNDGEEIFGTLEAVEAGAGMTDQPFPGQAPGPRPPLSEIARRAFGRRSYSYGPREW